MKSLVEGQDLTAHLGIPGVFVRAAWEQVTPFSTPGGFQVVAEGIGLVPFPLSRAGSSSRQELLSAGHPREEMTLLRGKCLPSLN